MIKNGQLERPKAQASTAASKFLYLLRHVLRLTTQLWKLNVAIAAEPLRGLAQLRLGACPADLEADRGIVTKSDFGLVDGAALERSRSQNLRLLRTEAWMSARGIYKGFTFAGLSTQTDNGEYRARVAIMTLDGTRTSSQRFLDLEIFRTEAEANERAIAAAKGWIDEHSGQDQLALPTNFALFG